MLLCQNQQTLQLMLVGRCCSNNVCFTCSEDDLQVVWAMATSCHLCVSQDCQRSTQSRALGMERPWAKWWLWPALCPALRCQQPTLVVRLLKLAVMTSSALPYLAGYSLHTSALPTWALLYLHWWPARTAGSSYKRALCVWLTKRSFA